MSELYILPCSKTKIWDVTMTVTRQQPAKDVYQGQLFLKGKSFAIWQKMSDPAYLILSAKYGFIYPETLIENYNETFKSKKPDLVFLSKQIREYELTPKIVIVLGGSVYADIVRRVFKNSKICLPLLGLPIGKMLQALNNPVSIKKNIDDFIWNVLDQVSIESTDLVQGCHRVGPLPTLDEQEQR